MHLKTVQLVRLSIDLPTSSIPSTKLFLLVDLPAYTWRSVRKPVFREEINLRPMKIAHDQVHKHSGPGAINHCQRCRKRKIAPLIYPLNVQEDQNRSFGCSKRVRNNCPTRFILLCKV